MKIPMCRPCSSGLPQNTGSFAASTMSLETGTSTCAGLLVWSGLPRLKTHTPIQIAIQLSMIVEITSFVPANAFSAPAIPPHTAPPAIPPRIASRMCRKPGMPSNDEPIQTAKIEPMINWP